MCVCVTGTEIGLRKRWRERFGCIYSIRGSGMDTGGCADEW